MTLKAINPGEVKPSKVKFLLSGEAGSGKSWLALDFPSPYLMDCESGAVRKQYQDKLKKVGGAYFGKDQGAESFADIIEEVKTLATTKHQYKTLIIDSFSHLYLLEAAEAELKVGSDFGKDRKAANKPSRELIKWLNKCDMNIILIAHSKIKWARKGNEIYQDGNTFEGYAKLEYDLDLWVELSNDRKTCTIKKSRIESLPQGTSMPVSYSHFAELYGQEVLEAESIPADLATADQIKTITGLVEALNIEKEQIEKWFKKVDVDGWEEMTSTQILGLTDVLNKKVEAISKDKK